MEAIDWLYELDEETFRRVIGKQFNLESGPRQGISSIDRYWIDNFCTITTKRKLHGSFDYCFENAAY